MHIYIYICTNTKCIPHVPAHICEIKNFSNRNGAFSWWISDHIWPLNFAWLLRKTIISTGRTPSLQFDYTQTQNLYSIESHSKINKDRKEKLLSAFAFQPCESVFQSCVPGTAAGVDHAPVIQSARALLLVLFPKLQNNDLY